MDFMFFFIFISKNTIADGIIFFNFLNISNFDLTFYVFKIKFVAKSFLQFFLGDDLQDLVSD